MTYAVRLVPVTRPAHLCGEGCAASRYGGAAEGGAASRYEAARVAPRHGTRRRGWRRVTVRGCGGGCATSRYGAARVAPRHGTRRRGWRRVTVRGGEGGAASRYGVRRGWRRVTVRGCGGGCATSRYGAARVAPRHGTGCAEEDTHPARGSATYLVPVSSAWPLPALSVPRQSAAFRLRFVPVSAGFPRSRTRYPQRRRSVCLGAGPCPLRFR